jgi:hypothetical protein
MARPVAPGDVPRKAIFPYLAPEARLRFAFRARTP